MTAGLVLFRTDRERVLQLEAQVASLSEQLAAYHRAESDRRRDDGAALREEATTAWLRRVAPSGNMNRHSRAAARLLIALLAQPGRLVRSEAVLAACRSPLADREPGEGLVKVVVHWTRYALRAVGHGEALTTVRGKGLVLSFVAAGELRRLMGLEVGDA